MVNSYRELLYIVAPPVILLDLDGVIVDWDEGFYEVWKVNVEALYRFIIDYIPSPCFRDYTGSESRGS